jgi:hypothetical protein
LVGEGTTLASSVSLACSGVVQSLCRASRTHGTSAPRDDTRQSKRAVVRARACVLGADRRCRPSWG